MNIEIIFYYFIALIQLLIIFGLFIFFVWSLWAKHLFIYLKGSSQQVKKYDSKVWEDNQPATIAIVIGVLIILVELYGMFFEGLNLTDLFWVGLIILTVGILLNSQRKKISQSIQKQSPEIYAIGARISFIFIILFLVTIKFFAKTEINKEIIIATLIFIIVLFVLNQVLKMYAKKIKKN